MSTVVTGSAGLVGERLIIHLKKLGHEVVGVDRQEGTPDETDHVIQGDLADQRVREEALEGADAIFHLAAAKDDWGIDDDTFFLKTWRSRGVSSKMLVNEAFMTGCFTVQLLQWDQAMSLDQKTTH